MTKNFLKRSAGIVYFVHSFLFSGFVLAQSDLALTSEVTDPSSLEFPLGKETRPNLILRAQDDPQMAISIGLRMQGTAELSDSVMNDALAFDFFMRRVRFEIGAQFSRQSSFVMDIRNDNANRGDSGERSFNVGDAYFQQKGLGGKSYINLKVYRAKVDVSRSETVKSSWLVYYDRPFVADAAAQFVNHNRRAPNVQLLGDFDDRISYSLVIGDGVQSGAFDDAIGANAVSIDRQNPMFGGKVVLSPLPGWEETVRTETYFGQGQHFALGVGAFHTGNIQYRPTITAAPASARSDRTLLNLEASAHYRNWFVQAEYFRFWGVVRDFSAPSLEVDSSQGWYVTSEYCFPNFHYLAPFVRFERWNRYEALEGFVQQSRVAGINWYLRGNTTRVGLAVQSDSFGPQIDATGEVSYKFLSQLHF